MILLPKTGEKFNPIEGGACKPVIRLTRQFTFCFQATEALGEKCHRLRRNSTILIGRKPWNVKKRRTRKKWRPPAGTRGTARARACSPTSAPSPEAVLSATNVPRAVTNGPRAYPVPLATNDPRVATRGTKAAAADSATKGDFRLLQYTHRYNVHISFVRLSVRPGREHPFSFILYVIYCMYHFLLFFALAPWKSSSATLAPDITAQLLVLFVRLSLGGALLRPLSYCVGIHTLFRGAFVVWIVTLIYEGVVHNSQRSTVNV